MKTFNRIALAVAIAAIASLALNLAVSPAEAAPKPKAQLTGPADGGSSTPVCFGVDSTHASGQQRVITFETHQEAKAGSIPYFCMHTCPANGGTPTAPTATLASCTADCTKDYVPLLTPLGVNTIDGGFVEPPRYTTVQFDMASDNCVSVAPADATLPLDGGISLYEVTGNNIPRHGTTY